MLAAERRQFGDPGRTDWAVHVALWSEGVLVAGAVALPGLGQVLVSDATEVLLRARVVLRPLGEHRLRGLRGRISVHQIVAVGLATEFPLLRSVDPFAGNLPQQLSSLVGREEVVADVADLELRAATLDDASFDADLETALRPDDPSDPAVTRHWWKIEAADNVVERWVAEQAGRPVGLTFHRHVAWSKMPKRFGRVSGDLLPALRTPARLDALYAFIEERSRADGTKRFTTWTWEDDRLRLEVLTARGFKEERRERFWELDLVANKDRIEKMADESRARMRTEGAPRRGPRAAFPT